MRANQKLHLFREMVRIRCFEQSCLTGYKCGLMGGFLILTTGQEGLPVVIRSIMGKDDHTITGPRGIGAALASGLSMESMIAELFGLSTGCNSGKGGMFSFFAPQFNHWGCHATAAAQTPLALGFAFAVKYRNQKGVSFCTLGDGAINQGVFHETLNLAGLHDLPVVFIIENNQFGMGTSVRRSTAFKDCLAQRAAAYGIEWDVADGWELDDLHEKLSTARERAISESRPTVLEVSTYRHRGFSIADANNLRYRTQEDIDFHKNYRDPINVWRDQLIAEGLLNPEVIETIWKDANAEALAASENAKKGSLPTVRDITKHVYWEVDNETSASKEGRYFF